MINKEKIDKKIRESIGISFESNEEIYIIVRKHWIILVRTVLLLTILAILCLGIYLIAMLGNLPFVFTMLTVIGIGMIGIQYIFVQWINNELDIFVVTNRRIISYDQVGLLGRKMSQTTIDLVQEVNAVTGGFFGNLFQYGTIVIKTASDSTGDISDFIITLIPDPLDMSRKIHSFIDEFRHSLDPYEIANATLEVAEAKL